MMPWPKRSVRRMRRNFRLSHRDKALARDRKTSMRIRLYKATPGNLRFLAMGRLC